MSLSERITPCNKDHSIKEAVITLFLANPIIKPDRFKKLIENEFKEKFQQFQLLSGVAFQVRNKMGEPTNFSQQITKDAGFRFSSFEKGIEVKVLQAQNEITRNFISFHSLNYTRWANFYAEYINTIQPIADHHPELFVTAVSLHYVDQFFSTSSIPINLTEVFSNEGDYLPKEFFKSQISNYSIVTNKEIDEIKHYNRIEININNDIRPGITISHNISQSFKDVIDLSDLLKDPKFGATLEREHLLNKAVLKDILNDQVIKMINLI
jgi:uncharacterized protein (TIGR04255 family)